MTRRVYLYFLVTFLLGGIVGGSGSYYYLWRHGQVQRPFDKHRAEGRLKKALNLTDAQLQQIDRIFGESQKKLGDLQKEVDPQFAAIHAETRTRIRAVLSAEQAPKFDEFLRQLDESRRRRGLPPPH